MHWNRTENADRESGTIIVPGGVKRGPYAGFLKVALMKLSMSCWAHCGKTSNCHARLMSHGDEAPGEEPDNPFDVVKNLEAAKVRTRSSSELSM